MEHACSALCRPCTRAGTRASWLDELERLAAGTETRVFPPIGDLASMAAADSMAIPMLRSPRPSRRSCLARAIRVRI
jgi:hypothetical protein